MGDMDDVLPTKGTLLAKQNFIWCGMRGFQALLEEELVVLLHPQGKRGWGGRNGRWGFMPFCRGADRGV